MQRAEGLGGGQGFEKKIRGVKKVPRGPPKSERRSDYMHIYIDHGYIV